MQQKVEQKMSPNPVVSCNFIFGSLIEYILSFTSSDIFCLSVNITYYIPWPCSNCIASSPFRPVNALISS